MRTPIAIRWRPSPLSPGTATSSSCELLESIVNDPQTARNITLDAVVSRLKVNGSVPVPRGSPLKAARAQFERGYIAAALEDSHGRISAAADVLGLSRTNLYMKIRSLRISAADRSRS